MQVLDSETKFAHLGKPGNYFTTGFQRRLDLITEQLDLKNKKILDMGCGEGVWLTEFAKYTSPENVSGSDIDPESIGKYVVGLIPRENLKVCPAEKLEFEDESFDVVFTNEVLEHVNNDQLTIHEVIRVLKPGGKFVFFTPNRGWPFEQHGIFFKGKYIWGNIPLLPWLPKRFQQKFAPHVRNYWDRDIVKLFDEVDAKIIYHRHVFPGFDGTVNKFGLVGKLVQKFFHTLEGTFLHVFGISHFVIVEKNY